MQHYFMYYIFLTMIIKMHILINSNVSDQMQLLQSATRLGSEWIYQVKIDAILFFSQGLFDNGFCAIHHRLVSNYEVFLNPFICTKLKQHSNYCKFTESKYSGIVGDVLSVLGSKNFLVPFQYKHQDEFYRNSRQNELFLGVLPPWFCHHTV